MVALDISETSKSLAVVGGYISIVGLVSYFLKERLFMSEALLAFVAGIVFGPLAANVFSPLDWVNGSQKDLSYITFEITRVVIAIQVLFTGISLPKAYLWRERLSLFTLLIPIMTAAWFVTAALVYALIPGLTFLEALVIGSCVTPTDPVLANSICKGRFAEKYVPLHVRQIIVAEAGANDGLGFPFLFMALYLMLRKSAEHSVHSIGGAIGQWMYNIVLYQVTLSVVIGAVIGYIARKVLRFAEARGLIDHESFLSFGVSLTLLTLGIVGMIGSDDILCCFIVGNSFTWDDWFRVETEDHAFQDVIDQLLNNVIFLYIGSIMPWSEFGKFWGLSPWRLVALGICVILIRRPPWVMILKPYIPALATWPEAAFAGYFGPIGVGAVYYVQVALREIPDDGSRDHLVILPVVYFMVMTSVVVHGVTIPLGKGFQRAATITLSRTSTAADLVGARLPPAVPVGSVPTPVAPEPPAPTHARGESFGLSQQPASPQIHFDLPDTKAADTPPISRNISFATVPRSEAESDAVSEGTEGMYRRRTPAGPVAMV
ncbi:hypothetical protein VHUM_02016 [Vanrija humicola]|uniref:Cation/H+ exchanger transmembrane domain-containing protein n=1 Tax=Vanrija humicola TaxID=5417 RepID=A0A7D8V389_VANHU|nr:hypothetical protein VHUM_02016 [Vanrija humicola]